jgi:hypothetical protein
VTEASPRDDRFHPPARDDPHWSETSWYGFQVPERRLAGAVYPLFRPNLGTCSLSVHVWDDGAHEPWRVRYARCLWHLPMPAGELDDCELAGLSLRCLEPLRRYRVQYADGERLALDLEYEGVVPPHALSVDPARGHVDQPCRVRGRLRLDGEEIPVDGYDMRDRSWHVRDDLGSTRAGYAYAIAGDRALHAMSFGDEAETVVAGFWWCDGRQAPLTGGRRSVLARDPTRGFPLRVAIEARDGDGRDLRAQGTCLSRLAFQATPGMFAWMSLVEWDVNGVRVFGADQDIWSPDRFPVHSDSARASAA